MKNKKFICGLSLIALAGGAALVACGPKSARDVAAVHLAGKDHKCNYLDGSGWYSYSNLEKGYTIDDLVEVTPVSGSTVEYGKDLNLEVKAKDWVMLANLNDGKAEHNPYNGVGYAVPRIGYGNMIKDYGYELDRAYYTYKQDETNKQLFHLHVDGKAFQKNLKITFENENIPAVLVANSYTKDGGIQSLRKPLSDSTNEKSLYYSFYENFSSFDVVKNDGITIDYRLVDDWNDEKINYVYNRNVDCNENLFYTFDGSQVVDKMTIKGVLASGEYVNLKTKATISINHNGRDLSIFLKWGDIYDLSKYEALYEGIEIDFCNELPAKFINISTNISGSDVTVYDKGYGRWSDECYGKEGVKVSERHNDFLESDVANIGGYGYRHTNYGISLYKNQNGSKEDEIIWPKLTVKYTNNEGNSQTVNLESESHTTSWRDKRYNYYTDDDTEIEPEILKSHGKESELPFKCTSDGNFVVVCLNPKERTGMGSLKNSSDSSRKLTSDYISKHDTFMIHEMYPTGSYYYPGTGDYAKTVEFTIE